CTRDGGGAYGGNYPSFDYW
nr:immunoglobulin heavy chain junction region [Macaca mulatta]MOW98908.1 immunoglobulin heavy chain junction region [Macaca mulatta]MOW99155.1 immunoglobulin heavy chain junction region [Macaca mulatta]MOW99190.1 immunoglobulin heavy chain junction region [Macaca mulatta]MOW99462.1 immunoglobulin heavy chain junction region [Macaca mulatta]